VVKRVDMTRLRQLALTLTFLVLIGIVGIVQVCIEIRRGDPVVVLELFRHASTVENLRAFEDDLESESWFEQTLRPWMQYALFLTFQDTGDKVLVGRNGWWFYRPGVRYLVEPLPENGDGESVAVDVVAAILSFQEQLAARNIRLLVVPVPGKPGVYPDRLTRRADGVLLDTHTTDVISELRTSGVEVVDLFPAFHDARTSTSEALYLARDSHWTPAGLQVGARRVAERLRELGWAKPGTTQYETRAVNVETPGDVVEMIQCPPIERLFEPQKLRCEQVIDSESNEPYIDRENAEILVIGDSFLRIYERDETGSAGFISHLALELKQPLMSIVNDGGASTLVRQELARKAHLLNGKTVVVWEFIERDIRFGMNGWQIVRLPEAREEVQGR